VTAFIGDLAELFGCVLDVPDAVTAITFVALGTSMPDLFASQTAAVQDATADASIVNVTGSNSVNVFLGLGLPWTWGALYWMFADTDQEWIGRYPEVAKEYLNSPVFVVPSSDLGFSVLVFICSSVGGMVVLMLRRRQIGAELGGPLFLKIANAGSMVVVWFAFITLSSWKSLRDDKASTGERWSMVLGVSIPTCFVVGLSAVLLLAHKPNSTEEPDSPTTVIVGKLNGAASLDGQASPNGFHKNHCSNTDGIWRADNTDEEPPRAQQTSWLAAPPDVAAGPTGNGTHLALSSLGMMLSPNEVEFLEDCADDSNADHDMIPVQPLSTPSVPPLMSDPVLSDMTQAELFDYSMQIWKQSGQSPVAHLPNQTQEAHNLQQHLNSPCSLRSLDSLGSSPTKHVL